MPLPRDKNFRTLHVKFPVFLGLAEPNFSSSGHSENMNVFLIGTDDQNIITFINKTQKGRVSDFLEEK